MTKFRDGIVGIAVLGAALLVLGSADASTASLTCGATVTTDVTLTRDFTCPDIPGDYALQIGAAGITINLNGHVIVGDGYASYGILDSGFNGVTIENGRIDKVTGLGILLVGVDNAHVTKMAFALGAPHAVGLDAAGGSGNTFTTLSGGANLQHLVSLVNETNDTVSSSTADGAYDSFYDDGGSGDTFSSNKSYSESDYGFFCQACANDTFTGNYDNSTVNQAGFRDTSATGEQSFISNTVAYSGQLGFFLDGGQPYVVQNNVVQFAHADDYDINEAFFDNGGDPSTFPGSTITGNTADGSFNGDGFVLFDPYNVTLTGNVAKNTQYGFFAYGNGISGGTVSGNAATGSSRDGFLFDEIADTPQPTFTNNAAKSNGWYAIEIDNPSSIPWVGSGNSGRSSGNSTDCLLIACIPPTNTVAPSISGTTTDGQTLTASKGTWGISSNGATYAYEWRKCDSAGLNCSDTGATGAKHTVGHTDAGSTFRFQVTASDDNGTSVLSSAASAVIAPLAPVDLTVPTVTGTATDESTLSGHTGSWSLDGGSLSDQWLRCDSGGANCSSISGATGATYVLTPADIDSTIRFQVTGTNAATAVPVASAQTAAVAGAPPHYVSLPSISGTPNAGYTLTAHTGTWKGSPTIVFLYVWLRDGGPIPGAANPTYTLTDADAGHLISLRIVAGNGYGTPQAAVSSRVTIGAGVAPSNTVAPSLTPVDGGGTLDGSRLTAHPGTWTGSPTIGIGYQWLRCDSGGNNCNTVVGTASTYAVTPADVGGTIALQVTGSNAYGNTTVGGGRTFLVIPSPPTNTVPPSITQSGLTLTGHRGTWTGIAPIAYTYQWFLCDADGNSNCVQVGSALTLTLQPAYSGLTIRFEVSAQNSDGSTGLITGPLAIS